MQYKFLLAGIFLFSTLSIDIPPVLHSHVPQKTRLHFSKPTAPFWEQGKTKDPALDTAALKQSSWYADAIRGIDESEYEIKRNEISGNYTSPNRANQLRSFYTASTFSLMPRNDSTDKWELELTTTGVYSNKKLIYAPSKNALVSLNQKTVRFNHENNFITEYINSTEGIRQNFIIQKEPAGKPQTLNVKLETNKGWFINKVHEKELHFAKANASGFDKKITYNGLKVWDAENRELDASFEVFNNEININVITRGAVYPVTIDPLSTTADWKVESNISSVELGKSVASAGDVNGDGYSDVIIAAPFFNGGQPDEGKVFLHYGSITGLSLTAGWSLEGNQTGVRLGQNCSSAGDVNGDGFSDLIIGIPFFDNGQNDEGMVYVFHGSASGPAASPDWTMESDQAAAAMGTAVACAGDVNGDGYSDVIIGAPQYTNGQLFEGQAYIFHGSMTGLSLTANWVADGDQATCNFGGTNTNYGGSGVASAGDVNGDGCSDVLVSAVNYDNGNNNEGKVFLYLGSTLGVSLTSSWSFEGNQDNALMGNSIASAGDVNGDGYSDVVVGAPLYDNGQTNEGIIYIFHGSAAGLSLIPNQAFELDMANALFGCSVACAGDVNGDGYADVIAGASDYGNPEAVEGAARLYFGSLSGLPATAGWQMETDQSGYAFGFMVASAGDVNGDGYSDVIIGAPRYYNVESVEGAAFVYHGGADNMNATVNAQLLNNQAMASTGYSVSAAGDVNGDGYSDIIIGAPYFDKGENNEGAAFVYYGGVSGINPFLKTLLEVNQVSAFFGSSVACAGDVNGDGYTDVIVGAPMYDNFLTDEGAAFVFHGSPAGINTTVQALLVRTQALSNLGVSVAGAGDVNGDGYSDVMVGATNYDAGQTDEGAVFIFHGSAAGVITIPQTQLESNANTCLFGASVATAGDVNADGFSDVIVGAPNYDGGQPLSGAAFVYHGSISGITTAVQVQLGISDTNIYFGISVSSAGDVNGDGYSDIVVGATHVTHGQNQEGSGLVYLGGPSGISNTIHAWLDSDQDSAQTGCSVASAGDVNGDGYSDVAVGARLYSYLALQGGAVFIFNGSSSGMNTTASVVLLGNQSFERIGSVLAGAGDVNGDGYSDIVVGASYYDEPGLTDAGSAYTYLGNTGAGRRNNLRLYNQDLVTPIQQINATEPNLFGAGLFAKSALGRVKGKLVWEVKSESGKFSGNPITNSTAFLGKQPSFTDLGITGTELKYNVQKVGSRRNKIRTRVEYDKVTAITGQVYGPWRYPAAYLMGAYGMFSVPLPVKLISFNGQFINANDIRLNWITENEINMQSYFVERSIDGTIFTEAGELAATGQGSSRSDYSFIDKNVQRDLLYYRLRLKEKSGNISYTKIITVSRSKLVRSFIAPNPVQQGDDATLVLQSATDKNLIRILIFNSQGQLMVTENRILQKGRNDIPLSTNGLAKGIYIVNAAGDEIKESFRMVVQ